MFTEDIKFNMNWKHGTGYRNCEELPETPGIYCEVYWPVRGIRVGEAQNIKSNCIKNQKWMQSAAANRLNRQGPLINHLKDWGTGDIEIFVLSDHPSLESQKVRRGFKHALHIWAEEQEDWKNFNAHPRKAANYGQPVCDELQAAQEARVTLTYSLSNS
ncbi:hypothetical protein [Thalassobius sp. I31.1]|uniref:hypothetical protein n=1 Tax=Thalassobius sp. I31.1 TaxID=2109912 RepID=UPI000D1A890F|nr:hypothetical protein [Thalassobius sp. I31.1]